MAIFELKIDTAKTKKAIYIDQRSKLISNHSDSHQKEAYQNFLINEIIKFTNFLESLKNKQEYVSKDIFRMENTIKLKEIELDYISSHYQEISRICKALNSAYLFKMGKHKSNLANKSVLIKIINIQPKTDKSMQKKLLKTSVSTQSSILIPSLDHNN